jgi:pimeloyl-ACP methyl ester carboxylesterase
VRPGFPIHRVAFISPIVGAEPDYAAYKQIPVLIVQGTQDTVAPWSENGRRLLEGSADVTVEFVPNAGHSPHRESERITWQAVIGFLRDEYPVFVSDEDAGTQVIELKSR